MPAITPLAIALLLMLPSLTACEAEINQKNFTRIETGMFEMEVINILGEPEMKSTANNSRELQARWRGEHGDIIVTFHDGKVTNKSYRPENSNP